MRKKGGFTLIEMLIVIGLIALLATAVLVAVNPARQFRFARDSERKAHLATLLNAIGQNLAENQGSFTCNGSAFTLPSISGVIKSGIASPMHDIAPCLVTEYLAKLPIDPGPSAHYTSETDYDTGYSISQDIDGHITLTSRSEMSPGTFIVMTR